MEQKDEIEKPKKKYYVPKGQQGLTFKLKDLEKELKNGYVTKVDNVATTPLKVAGQNNQHLYRMENDKQYRNENITQDYNAKIATKKKNDKVVQDRKDRIAKANELQKGGLTRERGATALADKARLFPNDPNSVFDEYVNPFVMLGGMGDNLQNATAKDATLGERVAAVAMPLGAGALAGLGTTSTSGFANNLVNPLAGVGIAESSLGKAAGEWFKNKITRRPFARHVVGAIQEGVSKKKAIANGAIEGLDDANKWMDEWIQHPATRQKVKDDAEYFGAPSYQDGVEKYLDNYKSNVSLYPMKDQVKDGMSSLFNRAIPKEYKKTIGPDLKKAMTEHIHLGNEGVSYNHHLDFNNKKSTWHTPTALDASKVGERRRAAPWVSFKNNPSREHVESVGIHELTHDAFKDKMLSVGQHKDFLDNLVTNRPTNAMTDSERKKLEYLAQPTEMHARIMQLRREFNLKPNEHVDIGRGMGIFSKIMSNKNHYAERGGTILNLFKGDSAGETASKLTRMFNTLYTPSAAIGAGLGASKLIKNESDN